MLSLLVMMSKRQIEFDIFAVYCYDEANRLDAHRLSCITVNAVRFQTFWSTERSLSYWFSKNGATNFTKFCTQRK